LIGCIWGISVSFFFFHIGCARPTHPGVNTEVSYFDDWIAGIVAWKIN